MADYPPHPLGDASPESRAYWQSYAPIVAPTPAQQQAAILEKNAKVNAAIAARQQRDQQRAAEKERALVAQGKAELEAEREQAKASWLHSGGDVSGFQKWWDREGEQEAIGRKVRDGRDARERAIERNKEILRASGQYSKF